jgi:Transmembrane secretion effector
MAKPADPESSLAPFRDRAFTVLWVAKGPVLVTVEYQIKPADRGPFLDAIAVLAAERRRDGVFDWDVFEDLSQQGQRGPARSLVVGPAPGGHHARTGVSASAHSGRQDDTRSAGDRRVPAAYVDWDGAGDVESSELGCSCDCSTTISENLLRPLDYQSAGKPAS